MRDKEGTQVGRGTQWGMCSDPRRGGGGDDTGKDPLNSKCCGTDGKEEGREGKDTAQEEGKGLSRVGGAYGGRWGKQVPKGGWGESSLEARPLGGSCN